jgi:putative sugar O-methyltransferase
MKVIKEFLNYSKNIDANSYANQVHVESELILNKIINQKNIVNFRNNHLSYYSGALSHPDQFPGYWFSRGILRNYFSSLRFLISKKKKLKNFIKKQNLKFYDMEENNIGNPIIYKFLFFKETGTNITNCFYYSLFKKYFDLVKPKKIVEIGGGFGKLGSIILDKNPGIKYSLIELPSTSLTSFYYLSEFCKLKNLEDISFFFDTRSEFNQKKVSIITSAYLNNKKDEKMLNDCDLLINTESFMHMSENEIAFYINLIKKNKIRYILCINRLEKKREGETEFSKLFNDENIKLVEKIDLDTVLESMYLTFYENFN